MIIYYADSLFTFTEQHRMTLPEKKIKIHSLKIYWIGEITALRRWNILCIEREEKKKVAIGQKKKCIYKETEKKIKNKMASS